MNSLQNIWIEKYRPKSLNDLIIDDQTRSILNQYKKTKEIPHILLFGNPGCGKTSLAKILVNEVLECQYIYLNASDEKGIDTIRDKVISFAQTQSIYDSHKVIILDEADGLTGDAQRALRGVMEEYVGITRFILTGNSFSKIIEPLRSRCVTIDVRSNVESVMKHIAKITFAEKIKVEDPQALKNLVKTFFPDIRRCISELQKHSIDGVLKLPAYGVFDAFVNNLMTIIKESKDVVDVRRFLIENSSIFNDDYNNLLKRLLNCVLNDEDLDKSVKLKATIIICEHIARGDQVVDKEINCFGCLINLKTVIK